MSKRGGKSFDCAAVFLVSLSASFPTVPSDFRFFGRLQRKIPKEKMKVARADIANLQKLWYTVNTEKLAFFRSLLCKNF
jgi:hypothetical protein